MLLSVINGIASIKTRRVKFKIKEWFDGAIAEKNYLCDKLILTMLTKKILRMVKYEFLKLKLILQKKL